MSVIVNPDIVLGSSPLIPPYPLNHARIGYKTILPLSEITATSEAAGFPASALANPLTYDQYRPDALDATVTIDRGQAVDVDYIGVGGHNLSDHGVVISFEYSTDGVTWSLLSSFSPANNTPLMLIFNTVTARYFRFTTSATGIYFIGAVYIGQALVMQRSIYGGHSPISLSRSTEFETTRSQTGQWLGRTVKRTGAGTSFEWSNLQASWYRAEFDPFVKAARASPFFIAWNPSKFPAEVGFCWSNADIIPQNMGVRDFMSVSIEVEGLTDD